jgi:DNA-binding transcriptional ArsR family regulator
MASDLYKPSLEFLRGVEALEVLGDPVRRRILELLADGEDTSGGGCAVIRAGLAGTPAP